MTVREDISARIEDYRKDGSVVAIALAEVAELVRSQMTEDQLNRELEEDHE